MTRGVDHVASKQMQDIRVDLRGRAIVLMGGLDLNLYLRPKLIVTTCEGRV